MQHDRSSKSVVREPEVQHEPQAPLGKKDRWVPLVLRIFLPFAGAYFLTYPLRNLNAVIAPGLAHDFDLDAGQLGALTAAYFLGFAAMQIPIGVCLDRFSPSVVQACFYFVAAAGAYLFGVARMPSDLQWQAIVWEPQHNGLEAGHKATRYVNSNHEPGGKRRQNGC